MIPRSTVFLLFFASMAANGESDVFLEEMLLESFASVATNPLEERNLFLMSVLEPGALTERDVGFYLYTRRNNGRGEVVVSEAGALRRSSFGPGAPTKIIIHGWTDTGRSDWMHSIRKNYLSVADCNVIIVDWSSGSLKEYLVSSKLTRQVGDYVGRFVEFLVEEGLASFESVHIVGHSLGAHVAGYAGSSLSGRIGRITGLDPARPDFEAPLLRETRDRLDPTDALFVDVIHTCAGTAGFVRPVGHADFYPNGGSFRQPGCPVTETQYCSHGRSHQFMGESIVNPLGFPAIECHGWKEFKSRNQCDKSRSRIVHMGEQLNSKTRGVYFLETQAESPFGRGEL